ncbi:MAG: hypothetical protein E7049_10245 [Lentisphaerae bacterium]|nr:hypothetical protein [Lentisphaerota bacterium]
MKHHQFAGSVFVFIALAATAASAGVTEWTGESGSSIAIDGNWTVDSSGDDIYLVNSPNAATLGEGESFNAGEKVFYVGRGYAKNDQNEWGLSNSTDHDKGATLNINGGMFTSSARVWVGGGYSDFMDCILNISGGEMRVAELFTGDCASNADRVGYPKVNAINLSGGTLATTGNMQLGNFYLSTNALLQTGGTFAPGSGEGEHSFTIGHNGKATYDFNGGEFVPPDETHVGRNGGAIGVFNINKNVEIKTVHVGRDGGTGIMNVNAGTTRLDAVVPDGKDWYRGLNLGWGEDSGSKGYLNIAEGAVLETVKRESGYSNRIRICRDAGTYGEVNVRGTLRDNYQGGLLIALADKKAEKGIISEGVLNNWGKTYSKGGVRVAYGDGSKGTLNIYDGIVENDGDFRAGEGAGTTARVVVNGGALVNNSGRISFGHSNAAKTYVEINGGAVSNLVEHIYIGGGIPAADWNGYVETGNANTYTKFVMNDGTVYANTNIYAGAWTSADTVINGGLLEAEGAIVIGEYDMVADRTTTLTVNGGTLFAKRILKTYSGNKPTTVLNINGGTFKAKADREDYFENCGDLVITGDGLGFDTDGHDVVAHYWGARYSGDGGITKKGQGTLTLKGTYALTGKIKVEAGTLVLPENQTIYCEGTEVADGATLDLNGSTIVTVAKKVVASTWTNASGDGSAANAANWRSDVKYFLEDGTEKEDFAKVLDGVLPTADTDVAIPASSATRPDMTGRPAKSVTFVATSDVSLRGDCSAPAVVKTAVAWYDPDDVATISTNSSGRVVAVENKGTAGAALGLDAYDENSLPTYGTEHMIATRMVFNHYNDEKGFASREFYDFGTEGLTLFSVLERHEEGPGQVFGVEVQSGYDWEERGLAGIAQWPWWSSGRLMVDCITNNAPGLLVIEDLQNDALKPYIWCIAADQTTAAGFGAYKDAGGNMAVVTGTGLEYDSLGVSEHENGKRKVFLGMRRENIAGSSGYVGESIIFNRKLTDEEQAAVRDYLYTKWYTAADMSNIPANLTLENDARLDFGGGTWTFDKITGAGTIGNANVTVEDSVEPGLFVEGTVDFGDNAGFDFSSIHEKPDPGVIVLLTCTGFTGEAAIKNWNFPSQSIRLRTVDNNNGTVSVVAVIRNRAMMIIVR